MSAKKPAPKKPRKAPTAKRVAELRAKLVADPNTAGIAEHVGMSLDDYVKQVMSFIENPALEPELYIVQDKDLRAQGYEPPDGKAMISYLKEVKELLDVTEVSKFTDKKPKKVELDAKVEQLDEEYSSPGLKTLLEKELRGKRGGKT